MVELKREWLPILLKECPSLEWTKTYKIKKKGRKRGKLYVATTRAAIPVLRKYGLLDEEDSL